MDFHCCHIFALDLNSCDMTVKYNFLLVQMQQAVEKAIQRDKMSTDLFFYFFRCNYLLQMKESIKVTL